MVDEPLRNTLEKLVQEVKTANSNARKANEIAVAHVLIELFKLDRMDWADLKENLPKLIPGLNIETMMRGQRY